MGETNPLAPTPKSDEEEHMLEFPQGKNAEEQTYDAYRSYYYYSEAKLQFDDDYVEELLPTKTMVGKGSRSDDEEEVHSKPQKRKRMVGKGKRHDDEEVDSERDEDDEAMGKRKRKIG